ncbi:MAG: hypothetical protein AAF569_00120 [Pseudomonadota bacterium]
MPQDGIQTGTNVNNGFSDATANGAYHQPITVFGHEVPCINNIEGDISPGRMWNSFNFFADGVNRGLIGLASLPGYVVDGVNHAPRILNAVNVIPGVEVDIGPMTDNPFLGSEHIHTSLTDGYEGLVIAVDGQMPQAIDDLDNCLHTAGTLAPMVASAPLAARAAATHGIPSLLGTPVLTASSSASASVAGFYEIYDSPIIQASGRALWAHHITGTEPYAEDKALIQDYLGISENTAPTGPTAESLIPHR